MRGALFVALGLVMVLASPASFSKPLPAMGLIGLPDGIKQNNMYAGMAFGSPVAGTGGFQVMPSNLLNVYISGGTHNVGRAIYPMPLLPPFQAIFRGPTLINI